ncbi:MAG: hypothetical protein HLUCCO18_08775 [Rhodobacteraceae bacterium HLUCCO18]|nr:MAG: hypothetical protein HLUCCO18_08775 [Rhodobacteraceae bacterium HLUCCO18]
MSFETRGAVAPDHPTMSYPGSVLRFRAPGGDPTRAHVLCLGGTETFGRFVAEPYPSGLADRLRTPVINMGVAGGGLDVVLNDPAIADACRAATAIVLQVQGAQNLSNRLYTVHPRRNDRFVSASAMLRTIYRDVDFTEFHFTRHMLDHLRTLSPDRFAIVRHELRLAWLARMKRFLSDMPVPVHLLWLSCRVPRPEDPLDDLGAEPLFITSDMLEEAAEQAASLSVVAVPNRPERPMAASMAAEAAAARILPGPDAHAEAAVALARVLEGP